MALVMEKGKTILLEDRENDGAPFEKVIIGAGWTIAQKEKPPAPEPKEPEPEEKEVTEEGEEGEEHSEVGSKSDLGEDDDDQSEETRSEAADDEHENVEAPIEEEEIDMGKPGVDLFCITLKSDGTVLETIDAFDKKESYQGAVVHTGDNYAGTRLGDDEQVVIDFSKLSDDVHGIIVGVRTAEGVSFNETRVSSSYARLIEWNRGGDAALRAQRGEPEDDEMKPQKKEVADVADDDRSDTHSDITEEEDKEEDEIEKEKKEMERLERVALLQNRGELCRVDLGSYFGPNTFGEDGFNHVTAFALVRLPVSATVKSRTKATWYLKALVDKIQTVPEKALDAAVELIRSKFSNEEKAKNAIGVEEVDVHRNMLFIKPHAVKAGHVGPITTLLNDAGLVVMAKNYITLTADDVDMLFHDTDHPSREEVESFTDGECCVLVLIAKNAPQKLACLLPTLKTKFAAKHKGDCCHNAVHAIVSLLDASHIIPLFFPKLTSDTVITPKDAEVYVNEHLGSILAEGCAELCKIRPAEPIAWLAEWLLAHNPYQPVVTEPDDE